MANSAREEIAALKQELESLRMQVAALQASAFAHNCHCHGCNCFRPVWSQPVYPAFPNVICTTPAITSSVTAIN